MARVECPRCKRPEPSCYCKDLHPEPAAVEILILQHPTETRHPLNSARIAELGINNCEIMVGEDFSDSDSLREKMTNRKTCLLFPSEEATTTPQFVEQYNLPELCIVLDGTWRKAKKIYFLNPVLQHLPAVTLSEIAPSNYRIRKAPGDQSISTIEATVSFLREATGESSHQNCLDAFDTMINLQIRAMGQQTFQQNYQKHQAKAIASPPAK